ncbi:MAG: bifunctional nuclease domain-containing protein [Saprospiraceae bacterium]|nr:bifunctional nuclease domain-containing protein [Saprospiraceae bacterium]
MMSEKVELAVVALSNSESQPGHYTLVLEDLKQLRRIPIIIGAPEAQAIAMAMENITPPRPLTHDLLRNTLKALDATVEEVLIDQLLNEVFFAKIFIRKANGERVTLDARTSDAIALAVRVDAPVYTYESLVEEAGMLSADLTGRQKKGSFAEYTIPELEELLQKVVEKEDYESAARIRRYLDQRKRDDKS